MRRHGGLSATQQLDRIYENMNPTYQMYMLRSEVNSLAQLMHRMAEYDRIERNKTEYQARATGKKPKTNAINSTATTTSGADGTLIHPNYNRNDCCWNCGQRGHRKTQCKKPFRKFCSACGKTGVLTRDCHPPGNEPPAGKGSE